MHPNPAFRRTAPEQNLDFARRRGFGMLAVNAPEGPLVSHIPFVLTADGTALEAHLVRSNPIVPRLAAATPAVVVIAGGDAYVSPDWYGLPDQVPTWNYVAVHLRGTLRRLEDEALAGVLERLSDAFESRLHPKTPWTMEKLGVGVFEHLGRQIVPVAMTIETVDGTWKLSQNKPAAARAGVVSGLDQSPLGSDIDQIAALMHALPEI